MKNQKGFAIVFSLVIASVIFILVVAMTNLMRSNSQNMVYFNNMHQTFRTAESGLNKKLGLLSVDVNAYFDSSFSDWAAIPGENASFRTQATTASFDGVEGFYLVTTATRNVGGKIFTDTLHSYARISNAGDYFAAIHSTCTINYGINAPGAKIYGLSVNFSTANATTPGVKTIVGSVNYVNKTNFEKGNSIDDWFTIGDTDDVNKLAAELLFPQVTQAEIDYYKSLAHVGGATPHVKCVFSLATDADAAALDTIVDIYPPGYAPKVVPDDHYAGHVDNNADHVYYCPGDMTVEGRVHGQILFVAEGNININAEIWSAPAGSLPAGSYAHQAIFITKADVHIKSFLDATTSGTNATQRVEGLFLAPNGTILCDTSGFDNSNLGLNFNGSMILGTEGNFASIFQRPNGRSYSHMSSLKSTPPPYLPAIVDIYHSIEGTEEDLFNVLPTSTPSPTPSISTPPDTTPPDTTPSDSSPDPAAT